MEEQILDQLETPPSKTHARQSWDYRLNLADFVLNLLLIGLVIIGCLAGTIEKGAFLLAMLAFLGLGVYQLASALVGAVRGNRHKFVYLSAALGFLVVSFLIGIALDGQDRGETLTWVSIVAGLFLSFGGACYYTLLCYRAKNRSAP